MAKKQHDLIPLGILAPGAHVRITDIQGDRLFARRLLSLGLRVGSEVDILHRRGRGIVVFSDGNRVALGANVADKLIVEPLD